MGSNPTELDQVNRRVMQLEIEESALKNESDNASTSLKKRTVQMKRKQALLYNLRNLKPYGSDDSII